MWDFRGNLLEQKVRELITGEQKTSYGYDKAGRLAEVCASNGIRAQYRYDRNDMQTEVLYGNGLRTSYTYDERSQLTGMDATTPLKVMETCYTYDTMERLTKEKDKVTNFVYQVECSFTNWMLPGCQIMQEEIIIVNLTNIFTD